jgi:hypothetical protein
MTLPRDHRSSLFFLDVLLIFNSALSLLYHWFTA